MILVFSAQVATPQAQEAVMPTPIPPIGLTAAGNALWNEIASKYHLRPDEQATLLGACRAADMIAALRAAWVMLDMPMLTKGSMGQDVIHPLIGELRTQEAQKASLLARLKLPDDASGEVAVNQQRDAANSKWATGRGRGA
jgi:hypothetical protein